MNGVNSTIRAAILAEIIDAVHVRPQRPWEFTRQDIIDKTGCAYTAAQQGLERQVAEGALLKRRGTVNGKATFLYWRAEDVPE